MWLPSNAGCDGQPVLRKAGCDLLVQIAACVPRRRDHPTSRAKNISVHADEGRSVVPGHEVVPQGLELDRAFEISIVPEQGRPSRRKATRTSPPPHTAAAATTSPTVDEAFRTGRPSIMKAANVVAASEGGYTPAHKCSRSKARVCQRQASTTARCCGVDDHDAAPFAAESYPRKCMDRGDEVVRRRRRHRRHVGVPAPGQHSHSCCDLGSAVFPTQVHTPSRVFQNRRPRRSTRSERRGVGLLQRREEVVRPRVHVVAAHDPAQAAHACLRLAGIEVDDVRGSPP